MIYIYFFIYSLFNDVVSNSQRRTKFKIGPVQEIAHVHLCGGLTNQGTAAICRLPSFEMFYSFC
jgi:hypothetical protein